MDFDPTQGTVRRIDYGSAFRFTRLFQCFGMAIAPSRLLLALTFIVFVYIIGRTMDGSFWGDDVVIDRRIDGEVVHQEWEVYKSTPRAEFEGWLEEEHGKFLDEKVKEGDKPRLGGVFDEVLQIELDLFQKLVRAAIGFRPGFDQLDPSVTVNEETVIGSVRRLTVTLPGWLWAAHPGFLALFLSLVGALWALLGGAISRQMVVAAAVDRIVSPTEAVAFAARRWPTYVAAPLVPLVFILGMAVVLAVAGLVFWVPGLNILGGVLYVFAMAMSWVMTLLLVLWFAGVHMIYPAVSAQGSDALDAMSRSFSYVMSRPWRLFLYTLISLIYGAATYLFVGLFIYLMLALAQWATGWWVSGFNEVFPPPHLGHFPKMAEGVEGTDYVASGFIFLWVYLLISGLGAYAISFYFAAYSQIYLLLRQHTDGDDTSDVYEPQPPEPAAPVDKLEPVATVPAAAVADEVAESET